MNETRDGVRETLECVIERLRNGADSSEIADAILERFEVTPKPVVSDEELGRMARRAATCVTDEDIGRLLRGHIDAAGLMIVKMDRLERIQRLAHGAELFRQGETNEDRMAGLLLMDMTLPKMRPGDLDQT